MIRPVPPRTSATARAMPNVVRIAFTPPATTRATASGARSRPRAAPLRAPSIATITARPSGAKMWCRRRLAHAGPVSTPSLVALDRVPIIVSLSACVSFTKPGRQQVIQPAISVVEAIVFRRGFRIRLARAGEAHHASESRVDREHARGCSAEDRRAKRPGLGYRRDLERQPRDIRQQLEPDPAAGSTPAGNGAGRTSTLWPVPGDARHEQTAQLERRALEDRADDLRPSVAERQANQRTARERIRPRAALTHQMRQEE